MRLHRQLAEIPGSPSIGRVDDEQLPDPPPLESVVVRRSPPNCGCTVQDAHAAGMLTLETDPAVKDRSLNRLRRIEGQVRGLQKMVEEDRYCTDILTQVSSVHEALRAVGREIMRQHLRRCASTAVLSDDEDADIMYDEVIQMMYRLSR
jgi:DNA-binding FrmR family transcriptional regulator